jgi:hypothetical protein
VGAVSSGRGEQGLFATRLRRRLSEASQVWENIAQGAASHREMDFLLGAIHGQAQLLRWDKVARLIAETRNVLKDSMGESLRIEQYEAVGAALRFCVQASAAPPYDSDRDVEPMLLRLRRTRQR